MNVKSIAKNFYSTYYLSYQFLCYLLCCYDNCVQLKKDDNSFKFDLTVNEMVAEGTRFRDPDSCKKLNALSTQSSVSDPQDTTSSKDQTFFLEV